MKLILASKSPRRRQILSEMGYNFEIIPACGDEIAENLTPSQTVEKLALDKANEVFARHGDAVVIGSDTIVCMDGEILGKPKNNQEERSMLDKLSGKKHYVYTGFAVLSKDKRVVGVEQSAVYFNSLTDEQKQAYVDSGLGLDKAGGYGVQDGYGLVDRVEGSYYNVVGFPKERLTEVLKQFDIH